MMMKIFRFLTYADVGMSVRCQTDSEERRQVIEYSKWWWWGGGGGRRGWGINKNTPSSKYNYKIKDHVPILAYKTKNHQIWLEIDFYCSKLAILLNVGSNI